MASMCLRSLLPIHIHTNLQPGCQCNDILMWHFFFLPFFSSPPSGQQFSITMLHSHKNSPVAIAQKGTATLGSTFLLTGPVLSQQKTDYKFLYSNNNKTSIFFFFFLYFHYGWRLKWKSVVPPYCVCVCVLSLWVLTTKQLSFLMNDHPPPSFYCFP